MTFRRDLEGLRGVAVALVILFHAGLALPGGFIGVDAFYVLSGYLITGLLLRELTATGSIDVAAFYTRRARRILPAAVTALAAIVLAAGAFVAPLDLPRVAEDAVAAAVFAVNIVFAARATDYFASGAPSPVLHFWSLAVEEQFYVAWPLFVVLACRARQLARLTLAVFIISLALAVALTEVAPAWAFYGLPSRAWELALGALVAIHAPRLAAFRPLALAVGGWIGLSLLLGCAVWLDRGVGYPGAAALLPTVAVALVICGAERRAGPGALLAAAPLRWLGRISFSLYLYHWPVFVFGSVERADATPLERASAIGVALIAAVLSWRLVEEPFRRAGGPPAAARRALAVGAAAAMALVLVGQLAAGPAASSVEPLPSPTPSPSPAGPGARPVADAAPTHETPRAPSAVAGVAATPLPTLAPREGHLGPAEARRDADGLNDGPCGLSLAGSAPPRCELGAADGAVTVALIGDSHAAHWLPALERIARDRGWRIVPLTKDSCIFLDMRIVSLHLEREYVECARWRERVTAVVHEVRPDLVVVSSSRWVHPVVPADADAARQADAMARSMRALGTRVALIADTPLHAHDVPACLSRRDRSASSCATSRGYALTRHLLRDEPAARAAGATLIDPAPWLCDDAACHAVVDGTIAFRDDHHLTATMARRLAPMLAARLLEALAGR